MEHSELEAQASSRAQNKTPGSPPAPLLLLCHRIPYPPEKGDKIRSYHLLQELAQHHDVYLATFVDDAQDWVHVPFLRSICADVFVAPLPPLVSKLRSASGFFRRLPLSVCYYQSKQMKAWVAALDSKLHFSKRVVFSSVMSQFLPENTAGARTVVDFVDVDSDKWRQYASAKSGLASWLFRREARLLQQWEVELARASDASLFVSSSELAFFRAIPGVPFQRCGFYNNGVDAEFFDPGKFLASASDNAMNLVFTGAMDYWPNVDAVCWFAKEVLPLLRARCPEACFTIVGGNPSPQVRSLAEQAGVVVTGRVPDVRPYLASATAVVAPMRVARGIQNKVLEGMAMGKIVLTTAMGLEGITARHGTHVLVADTPEAMCRELARVDEGAFGDMGEKARQFVLEHHSWKASLAPLRRVVDGGVVE